MFECYLNCRREKVLRLVVSAGQAMQIEGTSLYNISSAHFANQEIFASRKPTHPTPHCIGLWLHGYVNLHGGKSDSTQFFNEHFGGYDHPESWLLTATTRAISSALLGLSTARFTLSAIGCFARIRLGTSSKPFLARDTSRNLQISIAMRFRGGDRA